LKDGKPATVPTDYSGAVRIKTTENLGMFGPVGEKETLVGLKVSPEPKIQWQQLVGVRVDKALDDQGQKLEPVMGQTVPVPQIGGFQQIRGFKGGWAIPAFPGGAVHQYVPVRFSKGEKAAKSLKEWTGVLTG